eukprot:3457797-Lingulodinium_polyedra.AAC.1
MAAISDYAASTINRFMDETSIKHELKTSIKHELKDQSNISEASPMAPTFSEGGASGSGEGPKLKKQKTGLEKAMDLLHAKKA